MSDTFDADSPMAKAIADRVPREVFHTRGNHAEVHLSEKDLSAWCMVAAQLAINLSKKAGNS